MLSLNISCMKVTFKWYLFEYDFFCWINYILHRVDLKKVDASKKNGNLKVHTYTTILFLQKMNFFFFGFYFPFASFGVIVVI